MTSPDVIVRTGRQPGPELRYCIRSLSQHLPGRVVTAGARVPWLGCEHIEVAQSGGKYAGAYAVLRGILACDWLTPSVVIADDDMFALAVFETLPAYHCGPLGLTDSGRRLAGWSLTLAALGPDALCRDLHVPTLIDRAELTRRLDAMTVSPERIWWRTLAGGGDTYLADVKLRDADSLPDGEWASTNEKSWAGKAGRWLVERFAEECEWER